MPDARPLNAAGGVLAHGASDGGKPWSGVEVTLAAVSSPALDAAAHHRFGRRVSFPRNSTGAEQARHKAKARRSLSLPLLTYSAPGGLRQGPGSGAESSAEATTCGNEGTACVRCRRMGDAVASRKCWLRQCGRELSGRWRGRARCPMCRRGAAGDAYTAGRATEPEAQVIGSAGAVRRDTTASEASR